ncbi:hypothetical protein BN128_298 [Cronobacter sakazakii 696]|nr:hypothetical protein BN128_298 [Cronobacter sakazakii 696]
MISQQERVSGSVTIKIMLTSVATSQEKVVAKPPRTKFRIFKTVRIKPQKRRQSAGVITTTIVTRFGSGA